MQKRGWNGQLDRGSWHSHPSSEDVGGPPTLQAPRGSAQPSTQLMNWARFFILMKSLIQRLPGLQGSFWNHSCGYSPLNGIVVPHWGSSLGPGSSRGTGWSARQAVEVLLAMTQRWDIFPWPCNCLLGLGSYLWRIALLCCSWTVLEV